MVAPARRLQNFLLSCGILASLLYVGTDILAGTLYAGYSFTDQAISELFAIGAPTSGLVVPLLTLYDVLSVAFALGVWVSTDRNRTLRIMALMVVGGAVNGLVLWNIFPMHMRGVETTFTDTMHVILAAVGVIFVLLALGFGATAFGKRFRLYSIGTILMLLVPGILVFLYVPQLAVNLPTQWVGLTERISTYAYLLWQAMLTIIILRVEKSPLIKNNHGLPTSNHN